MRLVAPVQSPDRRVRLGVPTTRWRDSVKFRTGGDPRPKPRSARDPDGSQPTGGPGENPGPTVERRLGRAQTVRMGDSARDGRVRRSLARCRAARRGGCAVPGPPLPARLLARLPPPARGPASERQGGMASVSDDEAMRRAIALAARGPRHHQPQPGGRLRAPRRRRRGRRRGLPRVRRRAARRDRRAGRRPGERARGGTAVVTLEPCNHTGRTGPCSQALIAGRGRPGGGRRCADPNPVAAGGADTLRAAGVEVEIGVRADGGRGRQRRLADRGAPRAGRT